MPAFKPITRSDPVINRAEVPKDGKLPFRKSNPVVTSKVQIVEEDPLAPSKNVEETFDDRFISGLMDEPVQESVEVSKPERFETPKIESPKKVIAQVKKSEPVKPLESVIQEVEEEIDSGDLAFLSGSFSANQKDQKEIIEEVCSPRSAEIVEKIEIPEIKEIRGNSKEEDILEFLPLNSKIEIPEIDFIMHLTESQIISCNPNTREVSLHSMYKVFPAEKCRGILNKIYGPECYFDLSYNTPNYFFRGKDHFIWVTNLTYQENSKTYFVCVDGIIPNLKSGEVEVDRIFAVQIQNIFV